MTSQRPNQRATTSTADAMRTFVVRALPRIDTRTPFAPGLRVVLALYAPLLVGLAVGNVGALVPVAIGALIGALADPGGAPMRRALTISATSILGALAFAIGDLAGQTPAAAIVFVTVVLFASGLAPEFGAAGLRGGLYIATLAIAAVGFAGVDPGWVTPWGIIAGGIWALALALGPFAQPVCDLARTPSERISGMRSRLRSHLGLHTALGRHAARMAVAGGLGMALALAVGRPHVGWIAAAAVTMLNPTVRSHGSRSISLLVGTVVGALVIVFALQSLGAGAALLAFAAPVLFFAVNMRSTDYAWFTVGFTAFMLCLSSFGQAAPWPLFSGRVEDTAIGVLIALVVWRVSMPHRERERLVREVETLQRPSV